MAFWQGLSVDEECQVFGTEKFLCHGMKVFRCQPVYLLVQTVQVACPVIMQERLSHGQRHVFKVVVRDAYLAFDLPFGGFQRMGSQRGFGQPPLGLDPAAIGLTVGSENSAVALAGC